MGALGGRVLEDILRRQEAEIENYLGSINEFQAGVRAQPLPKPDLLAAIDLVKSTGLPLVAGGVLDQPHIWLLQLERVSVITQTWDAINAAASGQEGS